MGRIMMLIQVSYAINTQGTQSPISCLSSFHKSGHAQKESITAWAWNAPNE